MSRVGFLACMTLAAATLAPAVARADDEEVPPLPPPGATTTTTTTIPSATIDAVHLRNGGLYRGRVTEIVPGDHVTILVAPGTETKRIAWAEIDRVIVASTPIPPAPTSTTPVTTPSASPPMVGPRVRVHITSPKRVILYRRPAGSSSYTQVCTSPCDMELPVNDTYRLAGNGMSQNKEVRLEAGSECFVDIVVDPPSTGGMVLGGLVAGAGATAGYVGLLMALIGQGDADKTCYSYARCEQRKNDGASLRDAGLVTMLVGAAVATVGVVVFVNSATTDVSQRSGGSRDARAKRSPSDAFLRTPTWKTAASSAESANGAPPSAFPVVFTGRF